MQSGNRRLSSRYCRRSGVAASSPRPRGGLSKVFELTIPTCSVSNSILAKRRRIHTGRTWNRLRDHTTSKAPIFTQQTKHPSDKLVENAQLVIRAALDAALHLARSVDYNPSDGDAKARAYDQNDSRDRRRPRFR